MSSLIYPLHRRFFFREIGPKSNFGKCLLLFLWAFCHRSQTLEWLRMISLQWLIWLYRRSTIKEGRRCEMVGFTLHRRINVIWRLLIFSSFPLHDALFDTMTFIFLGWISLRYFYLDYDVYFSTHNSSKNMILDTQKEALMKFLKVNCLIGPKGKLHKSWYLGFIDHLCWFEVSDDA